MKRLFIILVIVFGFASNGFAESILVKDNHTVQGMIDNARVVNGGTLTLQGIANGSIIIENGGTLNLLGVVNGKIENNGGKLFISGVGNLVIANSGYTEISGIVNTLTGNGEITIKPGSIISGKKY
tara:strand:- start:1815 stop:2192 length:378 start_codon:yes stop_codon:yes gene_type:complete